MTVMVHVGYYERWEIRLTESITTIFVQVAKTIFLFKEARTVRCFVLFVEHA